MQQFLKTQYLTKRIFLITTRKGDMKECMDSRFIGYKPITYGGTIMQIGPSTDINVPSCHALELMTYIYIPQLLKWNLDLPWNLHGPKWNLRCRTGWQDSLLLLFDDEGFHESSSMPNWQSGIHTYRGIEAFPLVGQDGLVSDNESEFRLHAYMKICAIGWHECLFIDPSYILLLNIKELPPIELKFAE